MTFVDLVCGPSFDPDVADLVARECVKSSTSNHFNNLIGVAVVLESHEIVACSV